TLLALELGEVARLTTSGEATQVLPRWGAGSVAPGGWVIHCAEAPPWAIEAGGAESMLGLEQEQTLTLDPEGHRVSVLSELRGTAGGPPVDDPRAGEAPAADDELEAARGCVRFQVPKGAQTVLSPHRVHGSVLSPALVTVRDVPKGAGTVPPSVRVVGSAVFVDVPPSLVELSVTRGESDGSEPGERVGSRVRAWTTTPSRVPL